MVITCWITPPKCARCTACPLRGPQLLRAFEVKERTASAYVQTDIEVGKLQGQVGLRYVSVDTPMQFTNVITGVELLSEAKRQRVAAVADCCVTP